MTKAVSANGVSRDAAANSAVGPIANHGMPSVLRSCAMASRRSISGSMISADPGCAKWCCANVSAMVRLDDDAGSSLGMGSAKANTAPWPSPGESNSKRPPINSTKRLEMTNPVWHTQSHQSRHIHHRGSYTAVERIFARFRGGCERAAGRYTPFHLKK